MEFSKLESLASFFDSMIATGAKTHRRESEYFPYHPEFPKEVRVMLQDIEWLHSYELDKTAYYLVSCGALDLNQFAGMERENSVRTLDLEALEVYRKQIAALKERSLKLKEMQGDKYVDNEHVYRHVINKYDLQYTHPFPRRAVFEGELAHLTGHAKAAKARELLKQVFVHGEGLPTDIMEFEMSLSNERTITNRKVKRVNQEAWQGRTYAKELAETDALFMSAIQTMQEAITTKLPEALREYATNILPINDSAKRVEISRFYMHEISRGLLVIVNNYDIMAPLELRNYIWSKNGIENVPAILLREAESAYELRVLAVPFRPQAQKRFIKKSTLFYTSLLRNLGVIYFAFADRVRELGGMGMVCEAKGKDATQAAESQMQIANVLSPENEPTTLLDIWAGSPQQYENLITSLKIPYRETGEPFLTGKAGTLHWVKQPSKGWQAYLAGLIYALSERKLINIQNLSAAAIMRICKCSFNTGNLVKDQFIKIRPRAVDQKYSEYFSKLRL